jgi:hypothetical protein
MGTQMITTSTDHFKLYLGVHKKYILEQIDGVTTFDKFVDYYVFINGVVMCLAGLFIMAGERRFGPMCLIIQMLMMIYV